MSVTALFEFDGADGATATTDSSGVGSKSVAFSGAAAIRTAQSMFGGSALRTTGAAGTYLTVSSGAEMSLTGDFSLHLWVRRNDQGSGRCVLSTGSSSTLFLYTADGVGMYWNSTVVPGCPSVPIAPNEWHCFGLARSGTEIRCFVDGFRYHVVSTALVTWNLQTLTFGRLDYNNNSFFDGYVDRFFVDKGSALWRYAYNPLTLAASDGVIVGRHLRLHERAVQQAPVWPTTPKKFAAVATAIKDVAYGGMGRISGTVKIKGTPNYPVSRRVRLVRDRDGVCMREVWSNPVTGAYQFDFVDPVQKYTVLAYDHEHNLRAVIADNLSPELIA